MPRRSRAGAPASGPPRPPAGPAPAAHPAASSIGKYHDRHHRYRHGHANLMTALPGGVTGRKPGIARLAASRPMGGCRRSRRARRARPADALPPLAISRQALSRSSSPRSRPPSSPRGRFVPGQLRLTATAAASRSSLPSATVRPSGSNAFTCCGPGQAREPHQVRGTRQQCPRRHGLPG